MEPRPTPTFLGRSRWLPILLLSFVAPNWTHGILSTSVVLGLSAGQCLGQSKKGIGNHPGPLVELNSRLLPKYTKSIQEGSTKVTIKNPNHFKAYYGLRFGPRGKDFKLEGKDSITLSLPDGEYILFLRFINERQVRESISFTIEDGEVELEDGKEHSQYSTVSKPKDDRRRNKR